MRDFNANKAWAYAYCHKCERYIARVERPPTYAWIMRYQARDCTIKLTDDLAMAGKAIQPCKCDQNRNGNESQLRLNL